MKTNALASLALVFATAFALADNLGTPTKVGALSRSSDYVYEADEVDKLFATRVPAQGFASVSGTAGSADADAEHTSIVFTGSNISAEVSSGLPGAIVELAVPDGSTSAKGVVQLSSATNSTSATLAATPAAVKSALDGAKAYTDSHAYTHPAYATLTGKPTANATPGFGGSFTVSQVSRDATGHIASLVDRTVTIPSATATATSPGLMSGADKSALDALASGAVTKSAVAAALAAQGLASTDDMDDMDTLAAKVAAIIAVLEALD